MNPGVSLDGPSSTRNGFTAADGEPATYDRSCSSLRIPLTATSPSDLQLDRCDYEQCMQAAGFQDFEWIPMTLDKRAMTTFEPTYWANLQANCPTIAFSAASRKPPATLDCGHRQEISRAIASILEHGNKGQRSTRGR